MSVSEHGYLRIKNQIITAQPLEDLGWNFDTFLIVSLESINHAKTSLEELEHSLDLRQLKQTNAKESNGLSGDQWFCL